MSTSVRVLLVAGVAALAAMLPAVASATPPSVAAVTSTFDFSSNMKPLGFSPRPVPLADAAEGHGVFNSDLAFWGTTAVQGTYAGFRLVDISEPGDPTEIVNWTDCASNTNTQGNQGDVIIWGNLVIRSWNSPTPAPLRDGAAIPVDDPARYSTPGSHCGDWPMFREPAAAPLPERGQEGVHIIDISDPTHPDVIGFVDTPCGSHTETLVPDLENGRLLVYSNSSANTTFGVPGTPESPVTCRGIDIVEVPLDDPADASYLRFETTGHEDEPPENLHSCHDTSVILGEANLVACAGQTSATGGNGVSVFSMDPADGGSKENPMFMYHKTTGGSSLGHSASFTWDGKYIIVGHEPGGGSGARCDAGDPPVERTFFYVDAETGDSIGQFTIPRLQTTTENCTTHNFNVVPTDKRYVMVSGNYQSGISVIDFTDPTHAKEIAYADPAPLVNPDNPALIELGGDWSTYWYNGFIYESDITRGLLIWKLADRAVAGARHFGHVNPQTQETTFPFRG
jgi:hypothetical protein